MTTRLRNRRFGAVACGRLSVLVVVACLVVACQRPSDVAVAPSRHAEFERLYGLHCAGCHGAHGKLGPAVALNDPLFLSIITPAALRAVITRGRGLMPAFGAAHAGPLQAKQVEALVGGMLATWHMRPGPSAVASLRAYLSEETVLSGDPNAGKQRFAEACAPCHGARGQGEVDGAGAVSDPSFLALTSKSLLRRIVITGRPELGMPDYRSDKERGPSFRPLTPQQVEDIVSYLGSFRPSSDGSNSPQPSAAGAVAGSPESAHQNRPSASLADRNEEP